LTAAYDGQSRSFQSDARGRAEAFQATHGYCESFNNKLRDEFLNGEIFYSLKEIQVLAERWRVHYNTVRPHFSLGYRPPTPAVWMTTQTQEWNQEPGYTIPN
jgi:transposase InsO family protein